MADQARPNDVRSALLQAVSHELRTPLAAILGLAVTLERTDIELAPEEARDLARRITANARKLDGMLTDLLDLDRLERGVVEADLFPTDLGELVREVVAGSELALQERISVDAPSLTVSIDPSKAERIVDSLLSNAVRHTPPGTMVRVRVEPAEGGALLLVEDEGTGIPEEDRDRVFEPFQQARGAADHAPGVGVGLTLVARFAALMGGRAWVQEREGGGASFRVFLGDGTAGTLPERAEEPG